MASDAASQPSPAASVASSATPNLTSFPSHKRTAPVDGPSPSAASPDAEDPGGTQADSAKKRRTGPGSRGVANLTPAQLAKKRANGMPCCLLHVFAASIWRPLLRRTHPPPSCDGS